MKVELETSRLRLTDIKINGKSEPHVTGIRITANMLGPTHVEIDYLPDEVIAQMDDPNITRHP